MDIDYVKLPPSATSEHQANDVASTFKDLKKGIETITKNPSKKLSYPTIRQSLQKAFGDLKALHPSLEISADYIGKICDAMIKLVCIMKSNYVTAEKMIRGFTDCGQHVEDAEHGKSPTVDYDKVMKRCYQEVTEDQKQCMKDNREIFGR